MRIGSADIMITLFGIPNCDTIKKTRSWLDKAGVDYQFHDYRKDGCPESLIKTFLSQFEFGELINTRGTTWRKLSEDTRNDLDKKSATQLMSTQPALIKRPLLRANNSWLLGFNEARLHEFVTNAKNDSPK